MIIRTIEDLQRAKELLNTQLEVAYDVETTGLSVRRDKVIGFSCAGEGFSFYVVLSEWNGSELIQVLKSADVLPLLNQLKSKRLITHNGSFDTRITYHSLGVALWPSLYADTMLMAHTANENRFNYGLKELGAELFGRDTLNEKEAMAASIAENGGDKKEFYKAESNLLAEYGRKDAELTFQLFKHFKKQLHYNGLSKFFMQDEVMPLYTTVTIPMELMGVPVDTKAIEAALAEITSDINQIESEIQADIAPLLDLFNEWFIGKEYPVKLSGPFIQKFAEQCNVDLPKTKTGAYSFTAKNIEKLQDCRFKEVFLKKARLTSEEIQNVQTALHKDSGIKYMFNLASTDHRKRLFFTKLNETALSYTDLGSPQIDDKFLDLMADKYPWAEKLRIFNKLSKLKSTYMERILETSEDGVFYPTFNQHRTTSGRYSGDLQQLPRKKDEDELPAPIVAKYVNMIRDFFVSGDGHDFVDADYTSLEVVVFADDSQDEALLDVIRKDWDFYSLVAIKALKLTEYSADKKAPNFLKALKPAIRQGAKPYGLGIRYGEQPYKISKVLNVSEKEAKEIYDNYLNGFPGLATRMQELIKDAKTNGYVKSKGGRLRRMPELPRYIERYGEVLFNSLELWKQYNERPEEYKRVKKIAGIARNLVNNALNFPIQSMAATIVSRASIAIMREYKQRGLQAYIAMSVHDEICTRCPEHETEIVKEIMQRCMETTTLLSVPLQAEPIVGKRYGDVK
jgi:DNA polymerase I-like protein with 3'-5' exonuclease and polymerase domains